VIKIRSKLQTHVQTDHSGYVDVWQASRPFVNPGWPVLLGRRDSLTASEAAANADLPSPFSNVAQLNANFARVGLSPQDVVVLSGAHTFGRVHCTTLDPSLYPTTDPLLNAAYAKQLKTECPNGANPADITNLDPVTPNRFDNQYYRNLQVGKGTLFSDRVLFNTTGESRNLVNELAPLFGTYGFFYEFGVSMVKMGNISPLTGTQGEIRKICSQPNSGY
jgi:peroxidase